MLYYFHQFMEDDPMRRFLFTLVQLTWGLPQTLAGFIMYLY